MEERRVCWGAEEEEEDSVHFATSSCEGSRRVPRGEEKSLSRRLMGTYPIAKSSSSARPPTSSSPPPPPSSSTSAAGAGYSAWLIEGLWKRRFAPSGVVTWNKTKRIFSPSSLSPSLSLSLSRCGGSPDARGIEKTCFTVGSGSAGHCVRRASKQTL